MCQVYHYRSNIGNYCDFFHSTKCILLLSKAKDISDNNFYQVPKLKDQEASDIIDKWLAMKNRCLTETQKDIVLNAFKQCPTPLYLKMIFDEASTWTSFAAPETTTLPCDVQKCIEKLFDKLEKMHGNMLVSKALAYLTLGKLLRDHLMRLLLSGGGGG